MQGEKASRNIPIDGDTAFTNQAQIDCRDVDGAAQRQDAGCIHDRERRARRQGVENEISVVFYEDIAVAAEHAQRAQLRAQ
jgi:hypothetical protein